ncbi:MAG: hypothetical protein ABI863_11870 [Ginsengibacter sp.]
MKRNVGFIVLAALSFFACKKTNHPNITTDKYNISAEITQDSLLKYSLGSIGIEDSLKISMPPLHAVTSYLIKEPADNNWYYSYKAAPDFSGADRITLMHYISAGGQPIDSVAIYLTIEVVQ